MLRAAFDGACDAGELRIVVHEWVTPVVLLRAGDWPALVALDRQRGLDVRRPGPVRITVGEGGHQESPGERPHRMLLTYHHALLDDLSARLVLREFFRAYLAGGRLPGGERRPDIGDYSDWLTAQYLTPAREFWSRATPPDGASDLPVPPPPRAPGVPRQGAARRARHRLPPQEAEALRSWSARWGSTEFGALQAAWALLLHRASGAEAAAPVAFSVSVSGRGVALDSVDRLPGPLRNALPVSVVVDPDTPGPHLLAALRDRALDMAAYEWVSAGQIAGWGSGAGPTRTLLMFKGGPRPSVVPVAELAAQGIRVPEPTSHDADAAFLLTLTAHHDTAGGLVLTLTHDPALLRDADGLLADVALLLRRLPRHDARPVRELSLKDRAVPGADTPVLRMLRPGSGTASAVLCLVPAPGRGQAGRYEQLALAYPGPEPVVLLNGRQHTAEKRLAALAPLLGRGERLVLGGFSGSGTEAYALARLVARDGHGPCLVVLATDATGNADFARSLEAAARGDKAG
ncbi:condensation domain-containing protein [Streptomyces sp. LHD-70]|uniref:condensation domain-containing protein n=1 Tax=Streptomyces sp. LHD-70 TaxID=3072140 RepID=UPI00280EC6EB|nr:condensation domain-containing protein [Streptomyces sp. LHD-70]MDQ8707189.1 condensation domain-containing protein [Streptomyces sp. LHD-70]